MSLKWIKFLLEGSLGGYMRGEDENFSVWEV